VAVHESLHGKGIGTALVIDAIKRCAAIAEQMGAAAVVLDVLKDEHFDRRWKFYADLGFLPLLDPDNPTGSTFPWPTSAQRWPMRDVTELRRHGAASEWPLNSSLARLAKPEFA
jgi:hypothetical protein